MPKEVHYYLFSRDELHVALTLYQHARGEKIPPDAVPGVRLSGGPGGPSATLALADGDGAPRQVFDYDQDQLLGAVVLFCKAQRIPLAVRANKRVELAGDGLALVATLNAEPGVPERQGGAIRYTDQDLEAARRKALPPEE